MHHYNIEFSDKNKPSIRVPYKSYDNSSVLELPGKWSKNGGQHIINSLISLLSNHNSDKIDNPVEGQTWFNRQSKTINVFDGDNWVQLGTVRPPVFNDNVAGHLDLENSMASYLSVNGGTMKGPLLLQKLDDLSNNYCAVNKDYIDQIIGNEYYNLLRMDGNSEPMTGSLILPDVNINNKNQIIPKKVAKKLVTTLDIARDKNIEGKVSKYDSHINVVSVLSPNNRLKLTFLFGVIYISRLETYKDLDLTNIGTFKNLIVHTNIVGENKAKFQSEGRVLTDKNAIRFIRYQKNVNIVDVSVYFIAIGYLEDPTISLPVETPYIIETPEYVPVFRKTTVSQPVVVPTPEPTPSASLPAPTPSPAATPNPTPSPAATPNPTPSPSVSAPMPTPTPSASKPSATPTPSPSISMAMVAKICIPSGTSLGPAGSKITHTFKILADDVVWPTVDYKFQGMGGYFITIKRDLSANVQQPTAGNSYLSNTTGTIATSGHVAKDETFTVTIQSNANNANLWSYCVSFAKGLVQIS